MSNVYEDYYQVVQDNRRLIGQLQQAQFDCESQKEYAAVLEGEIEELKQDIASANETIIAYEEADDAELDAAVDAALAEMFPELSDN